MSKLHRLLLALPLVLAAACAPAPEEAPVKPAPAIAEKPAFPELGAALPAGHTAYANASLARLFVVLTHEMEGRARRPHLVRYETPVSVGIEGRGGERYGAFLDEALARLRRNSGIAIARGPGPYNLHIRFIDGKRFNATLPMAFCVIAQGDVTWQAFAADPLGANARQAAKATRIEQTTIFIPDDARPYLTRNCLLEEVSQALGMSNDLFGLGGSSFNDDGAHLWPTKLDYLMLRVLYTPEMTTGLDRRETRDRALDILNRINPAGRAAPPMPMLRQRSLEVWSHLIARVFSRDASDREVREDVGKALQVVEAYAPKSAQHCHTLFTAGRVLSRPEPESALQLLDLALRVCDSAHGASDIRHARIKLQKACALSRLGRYGEAIRATESIWPVLAAHGQDRPLAALYTIQADALAATEPGRPRAAAAHQLAVAWSAYAMGPGQRAAGCRRKG
jgi:hypothetical protein